MVVDSVHADLDIALIRIFSHRPNEAVRHCTCGSTGDASISRCLIVSTPAKHPNVLALMLPWLDKILLA